MNEQNKTHPAVKPDVLVNSGALELALNSLKRGSISQQEIAAELESTAVTLQAWQDQIMNNLNDIAKNVTKQHSDKYSGISKPDLIKHDCNGNRQFQIFQCVHEIKIKKEVMFTHSKGILRFSKYTIINGVKNFIYYQVANIENKKTPVEPLEYVHGSIQLFTDINTAAECFYNRKESIDPTIKDKKTSVHEFSSSFLELNFPGSKKYQYK